MLKNPRFIAWPEISTANTALADGSSIQELNLQSTNLTTALSPKIAEEIIRNPDRHSIEPALSILERWLIADVVVADVVAVASSFRGAELIDKANRETHRNYKEIDALLGTDPNREWPDYIEYTLKGKLLELADLQKITESLGIRFTAAPPHVFSRSVQLLHKTARELQISAPEVPWHRFGFGDYKDFGEALATYYGEAWHLARSHLGVERTLVYFELSATLGASLILHPARSGEAAAIERAASAAYQRLRDVLKHSFEQPLGLTADLNLSAPMAKLVFNAGRARTSILEAAQEMKDSRQARSFRAWLTTLEEALDNPTPAGRLQALRLLGEIERVSTKWSEELDVKLGVEYRRRQLHLAKIPRIGALLEPLELRLNDPIVNRKGYLAFISTWYR